MAGHALGTAPERSVQGGIKCGIYVRISSDPRGTELGVKRQEEDCRAYSAVRGWAVFDVYCDNDVSAYKTTRKRPEWSRLVADIKAGRIQGVVAWHVDRLTRHPRELEDLIDFADQYQLQLGTVTGEIDLSTPTGKLLGRQLGSLARYESEHRGERRSRQLRQQAEAGLMQTHGMRCYGYSQTGQVIEAEAANIRDARDRVLRGESLRSIAMDWQRKGIKTALGNDWTAKAIKRILINPRIAGKRVHRGEVVADGNWDPIIDPTEQAKVVAVLTNPARLTTAHNLGKTPTRVHLLSGGLARCGLCGSKLVPQPSPSGKPGYACRPGPPNNGCGKIRIQAAGLEEHVGAVLLTRLSSPSIRRRLEAAASATDDSGQVLVEQIGELEQRLVEIGEDRATGAMDRDSANAASQRVRVRLEELRLALARAARIETLPSMTDELELAQWWENEATLDRKRDLIMTLIDFIEVHPASQRGRTSFDETRVRFIWK